MQHRIIIMVALVIGFVGSACAGTARVVRRSSEGGEIALSGGYMAAVGRAHVLMADECAGHFAVVARGAHGARVLAEEPDRTQQRFDFVCVSGQPGVVATR